MHLSWPASSAPSRDRMDGYAGNLQDQTVDQLVKSASEFHAPAARIDVRTGRGGRVLRDAHAEEHANNRRLPHPSSLPSPGGPVIEFVPWRLIASRTRRCRTPYPTRSATWLISSKKSFGLRGRRSRRKSPAKLQAGVWMAAAAGLGLITAILAVQALVFGIASYGIALHWSCLIVAGVFACLAALAFFKGRANAAEELTPTRTLHNIKRDIATAKEQLT